MVNVDGEGPSTLVLVIRPDRTKSDECSLSLTYRHKTCPVHTVTVTRTRDRRHYLLFTHHTSVPVHDESVPTMTCSVLYSILLLYLEPVSTEETTSLVFILKITFCEHIPFEV